MNVDGCCTIYYNVREAIKFQEKKFLRIERIVSQLTLIIIVRTRQIIIRIIRDNSRTLNFLLVHTKVYKMVKEIFHVCIL